MRLMTTSLNLCKAVPNDRLSELMNAYFTGIGNSSDESDDDEIEAKAEVDNNDDVDELVIEETAPVISHVQDVET